MTVVIILQLLEMPKRGLVDLGAEGSAMTNAWSAVRDENSAGELVRGLSKVCQFLMRASFRGDGPRFCQRRCMVDFICLASLAGSNSQA